MTDNRVTIEVESNIGEDGPLTVTDTLHQFLDAFELLSASAAQESDGKKIKWRLVSLSKNSPARAIGEAYSDDPSIPIGPVVRRAKIRLSDGFKELAAGNVVPWVERSSHTAKALFRRNLNGVGRTIFDLGSDAPRAVVVEKTARFALKSIERFEGDRQQEDKSRSEFGSIDAYVAEAKTWHGRPALYVRERLSNKIVPCVLSEAAAQAVGPTHSWADAWSGNRIRIKGQIFYDSSGAISRVNAVAVNDVAPLPVDLKLLRKIDLLQGRDPVAHIDELWGYTND